MSEIDDIDPEELADAEALARALDGFSASDAPRDSLETAAFLRSATRAPRVEAHVRALEQSILNVPAPIPLRAPRAPLRALAATSIVLAAAAAFVMVVLPEGDRSAPRSYLPAESESAPAPPSAAEAESAYRTAPPSAQAVQREDMFERESRSLARRSQASPNAYAPPSAYEARPNADMPTSEYESRPNARVPLPTADEGRLVQVILQAMQDPIGAHPALRAACDRARTDRFAVILRSDGSDARVGWYVDSVVALLGRARRETPNTARTTLVSAFALETPRGLAEADAWFIRSEVARELALLAYAEGDMETAAREIERTVRDGPPDDIQVAALSVLAADAYLRNGRPRDAERALSRAREIASRGALSRPEPRHREW